MKTQYHGLLLTVPLTFLFAASTASVALADEAAGEGANSARPTTKMRAFLDRHCFACHDSDTESGGLNLAKLSLDLTDSSNRQRWITVFDRVHSGEMPPKGEERPADPELKQFLSGLSGPLKKSFVAEYKKLGRVRSRRLNRVEYENTMHDLLGIDIPLREFLPEDSYHDGFATVATAQQVSHHLLEKYLDAADASLKEAFERVLAPAPPFFRKYTSRQLGRRSGQRDPWYVGDETIAWSTQQVYHGRIPETRVRRTGWYRVTLHDAHSVNVKPGEGVWCTVRSGVCFARAPIMYPVGVFRADEVQRDRTFEAWIRQGHMLEARPSDHTVPRFRPANRLNNYKGSRRDKRPMPTVPGLAYSSITLQSMHKAPPRGKVRKLLFGELEIDRQGDNPGVTSKSPREDAARLMRTFAARAFRRPVTAQELAPYLKLVNEDLAAGQVFVDALRGGYRAVLCSPRFLYFNESTGQLDDYAIATRLSYFLWSSTPDAELLQAAKASELTRPKTRHNHVERMLKQPRAKGLVTALADQWLNLREIDFTVPDARLYREFDEPLKQSMIAETHAFLDKLIREDLPASNIIHSDFAMLNERLAKHYKIPGVKHQEIRAVKLKPWNHRGGLITQGSILKVTANGTTTSPVVRGAFINERILGISVPPPPDNVPAIEPDIRGAVSIRDQLKKHRDSVSCAACHIKIDPPGFALENYDVIGGWRTSYRTTRLKGRQRRKIPVDPHSQLASGEAFDDIQQFKKLILRKPRRIARNFTNKLVTYSTGAPVSFGDRDAIEEILNDTRSGKFRVRSLIHAVIDSPVFLSK